MAGTTRREFKEALLDIAQVFRQQIEAGVDGFATDTIASAKRKARAQTDFRFFHETYFPHYAKAAPSVLHLHIFETYPAMVDSPTGARNADAAPRGEAKSTLVSQSFTLWCAATGRKHFPVIIMDAFDQAATMLEAIKAELEINPRLAMDFPDLCGRGRVWREGVAITRNEVKFQAFGAGTRMRGVRHGPYRPDLVVLDDIENDEQVRSPDQRDKRERWIKASVLSLGPADDTMDVFVVGTILHYDSVLARLRRNPLWTGKTFKAIMRWPDDMALWDEWEAILLNDGEATAKLFYAKHKKAMDAGAVVSWPAMRPLYSLMHKRARDGHAAFDSEQQNDPSAGDAAPLASSIRIFTGPFMFVRHDWVNFGAVDPSLGKAGGSRDPSAVLVGAFSRELRKLQVLVASIKKRIPDKIVADIIALQRSYQCIAWAVEAVQFQEFFRQVLIKASIDAGCPIPARAVIPHADKTLRIESLQPYLAANIEIHADCATLIDQMKHFPMGDHDDGPDALQMLWMLASTSVGTIEFQSSRDLDADRDDDDHVSSTRESW